MFYAYLEDNISEIEMIAGPCESLELLTENVKRFLEDHNYEDVHIPDIIILVEVPGVKFESSIVLIEE